MGNVPKSDRDMNKEGTIIVSLTWCIAVNAEVVALCVADRLQGHSFTLAVFASLWKTVYG